MKIKDLEITILKNSKNISTHENKKLIRNIYLSHKDYYDCFDSNKKNILNIISAFLYSKDSDLSKNNYILNKNKLVGFISYYKCDEYKKRLLNNFFIAQKFLNEKKINNCLKKLRKFQKNFDNISSSSTKNYLSRIVIFKKYRNNNIGSEVLKKLFKGKKLYLHVKKNNKNAKLFYLKNNFKILKNKKNYILMRS
tara:strand:+ start:2578 stop:3162 length:585 start_codon:yes stop_codon:yes gene_type:complete